MFFKSYYNEGPGVRPDEPQKIGVSKYFELIFNDFWSFIGISMFYLLCCLPFVTIGGATLAFNRLCCKRMHRQHVFVWEDYKEAFKECFKKGIILSFIIAFVLMDMIILYTNALGYMQSEQGGMQAVVVWAFCAVLAIILISICQYLVMVIANFEDQPFVLQLQNAVLLMIIGGVRTLVMALFDIVVFAVCFTYFPISGMVMFVGGFYILFFTNCFFTWPVIQKQLARAEEEAQEEEKTADEEESEAIEEEQPEEEMVDAESIL